VSISYGAENVITFLIIKNTPLDAEMDENFGEIAGFCKLCFSCTLMLPKVSGFFVTPASLKINFIASKVKLMNYLIYCEGDIILYYDIYKENK